MIYFLKSTLWCAFFVSQILIFCGKEKSMENYTDTNNRLVIDETGKAIYMEMTRWTKFLAIVGFVMIGLMILLGLFMGSIMTTALGGTAIGAMSGIGFTLIYLLIAALYFYPTYALYKYSVLIKPAINNADTELFNRAIGYKKGMFVYMGVLMIIVIALYALIFLFAIMGGVIGAMNS
ncbi:hypothetical protein CAP35_06835 [Chitinophagaceae bacterium IBVUCB1]|nr:hypothetical protein CAP35_06835 [Chitinophagaceae bacterium IBVUCB1]